MKALSPLITAVDLGEGFPFEARQQIDEGERALTDQHDNNVQRWVYAGAAWFMLQNVAMYRSGSNVHAGQRYNRTYNILVTDWPQLAKIDPATRRNAIWLYEHSKPVLAWLATLPQRDRDRWTHPATLRRHYEKRHPQLFSPKAAATKQRPPRQSRAREARPLGPRSYEDLEAVIAEQTVLIADREREITEKDALLAEQDRTIRQLQSDLAWERSRARQLESVVTLSPDATPATVKRPDGATVEVMHATARASHEIEPPVIDGQPDYPNWAKQVARRTSKLSALELHWLLADNSAHFDTYERLFPGAGTALENRVMTRIHELEETRNH